MPYEKWFISDTHFFHENIIRYCGRPFVNAEFMNESLVDRWNSVVGKNDKVYHLGDVALGFNGDDKELGKLLGRLNGKKRLIVGNHDNLKSPALHKHFEKIEMWVGFKTEGFTCTHVPYRLSHLRDGAVNVHGHTHVWSDADPRYINVCVEQTDYYPIHISEIVKKINAINLHADNGHSIPA